MCLSLLSCLLYVLRCVFTLQADKGFKGADGGNEGPRNAPVQFEKDDTEADPFGLDAFIQSAKKGSSSSK